LLVGEQLQAFEIIPGSLETAPGAIHVARIQRISRRPAAAWLGLASGASAFLRLDRGLPTGFAEGGLVPVQVEVAPWSDKEARVSLDIGQSARTLSVVQDRRSAAGRIRLSPAVGQGQERDRLLSVLQPALASHRLVSVAAAARGLEATYLLAERSRLEADLRRVEHEIAQAQKPVLIRAAPEPLEVFLRGMSPPEISEILIDDPSHLAAAKRYAATGAPNLTGRLRLYDGGGTLFETEGVAEQLAGFLDQIVPLPGAGSLIIESGATLTAIDVNSGNGDPLAVNRAAVDEIAHQLRLRRIAGAIVVDFMTVPQGARRGILDLLRARTRLDPAGVQVMGWTPLGHVELTRRRTGPSLAEALLSPAPAFSFRTDIIAGDAMRALLAARRRNPSARLVISTLARVAERLQGSLGLVEPVEVRVETKGQVSEWRGFEVH